MRPEDVPDDVLDAYMKFMADKRGVKDSAFVRALVRSTLAAVLPVHEATVRETVAREIDAYADQHDDGSSWGNGMACAVEIARGKRP